MDTNHGGETGTIEESKKLTMILTLKIKNYEESDLERINKLLLPSIKKFFKLSDLREFIIIVPKNEYNQVNIELKNWLDGPIPIRIMGENEIFDTEFKLRHFGLYVYNGWFKQRLIKYQIANYIKDDFYMYLDSDLIMVRPTSYNDLIKNGKAIFQKIKNDHKIDFWSKEACNILGYKHTSLNKYQYLMGVTPEILHRGIVLEILNYIEKKYAITWTNYLWNNYKWANGPLYWVYLINNYPAEEYHSFEPTQLYLSNSGTGMIDSTIDSTITKMKNKEPLDYIFHIVQSVNHRLIKINQTVELFGPFIFE